MAFVFDEDEKEDFLEDFGTESAGIVEAYEELTRPAFAVWVRMMTMTPDELECGRDYIASQLGYSEPGASQVLKELTRKAYLRADSVGPFFPTRFVILKRLILKGDDHIIKLG